MNYNLKVAESYCRLAELDIARAQKDMPEKERVTLIKQAHRWIDQAGLRLTKSIAEKEIK